MNDKTNIEEVNFESIRNFDYSKELKLLHKQLQEQKQKILEQQKVIRTKNRVIKKIKKEKNKLLNKLNSNKSSPRPQSNPQTILFSSNVYFKKQEKDSK